MAATTKLTLSARSSAHRRRCRLRFASITTGAVLALVAATTGAARAAATSDTLSVTRHEIVLGENTLRYTATAGLLPIRNDDTGEPVARMFFVAYALDRAAGEPPRPLTFLWNGGPGANSSQVHLLGFGPRRPRTGDVFPDNPSISEMELLPNEETWLVHSDLVFVDPIGTGYSRATKSEYIPILYTSRGDIEAVAEFIRVYRTRFDAWDAPLFLAGESYGTTRAMGVAEALERRRQHVAGVVLISGSFDVGDRVPRALSAALQVPTYTAAAHFHEKLPDDLQQAGLDAALREAEAWAREEYAPALERRERLSPSERRELVEGLARYTGLDPDVIDTATITVSKPVFADRLLQDRGQELGRYDLRMAQPARDLESVEWSPMTDASLVPLLDLMQGNSPLLIRYLRRELRFEADALYRGPFGEAFHPTPLGYRADWMALLWNNAVLGVAGAPVEPAPPEERAAQPGGRSGAPAQPTRAQPPLRRAMEINPRLRVLNVKGMYDGSCPLLEHTVSLAEPALRRRIRNECYAGGHQLYTDLVPRQELQRHFGEFVRETPASSPAQHAQTGASPERAPAGIIEHVWRPVRGGGEEVTAIEVRTELTGLADSVGRDFSLNAPITYAGVPGIADRVRNLRVTDPAGEVRLHVEDDEPHPGGFPYYRRWHAERVVTFPVVISYRSLAPTEAPRGPPFGLLAAYGGVSGAGSGFLVLPEGDLNVSSRVHWDLTDLAPGSSGVTTFGVGDFEVRGSPSRLRQGWIMAGPVGTYPAEGIGEGFSAVWLGTPAWDPQKEMAWSEEMYRYLGRTYGYLDPLPNYRVFIRVGFRSGTALGNSFMGGAPARQPGAAPEGQASRGTFVHEMSHMWVGDIGGPQGVTSWFSEGLNTYYTRLLPMRGGFTSVEEYGREINQAFERYYTSPARNLSADSIVRVGFNDEEIRHIPYIRGSLYFADLDAKIRAHSGGTRDLHRVLFEIFERREAGERFDHDVWIETVVREAGPSAREDFEDIIIRGTKTLVPASDAFGPCFERHPTTLSVDGQEIAGYEWVRMPSVPDATCRGS